MSHLEVAPASSWGKRELLGLGIPAAVAACSSEQKFCHKQECFRQCVRKIIMLAHSNNKTFLCMHPDINTTSHPSRNKIWVAYFSSTCISSGSIFSFSIAGLDAQLSSASVSAATSSFAMNCSTNIAISSGVCSIFLRFLPPLKNLVSSSASWSSPLASSACKVVDERSWEQCFLM